MPTLSQTAEDMMSATTMDGFVGALDDGELNKAAFTSRWVAAERAIESDRPDALFKDPFAKALGGASGKEFSDKMAANCEQHGLWSEYHRTWMAVRTRAIDDAINDFAAQQRGSGFQIVNLGAGLDARAYRLESLYACRAFYEVDQAVVGDVKDRAMETLNAVALCPRATLAVDLVEELPRLGRALKAAGFSTNHPTLWLLEGLTMYLPEAANLELLRMLSELSASGSTLCCGFIGDNSKLPVAMPFAPSRQELESTVKGLGWSNVRTAAYGEAALNFGRYPKDRAPDESQCICYATMKKPSEAGSKDALDEASQPYGSMGKLSSSGLDKTAN